jgi:hypothetical protein
MLGKKLQLIQGFGAGPALDNIKQFLLDDICSDPAGGARAA